MRAALIVSIAFGFSVSSDLDERRGHSVRAADEPGKPGSEFAGGAGVRRDQQPFHVGDEAARFEFLALETLLLLAAERQPRQRPSQRGRHRRGRDHGHGDDDRVEAFAQDPARQPDSRDDHFGRAARVHAASERERFGESEPADPSADEGAGKFSHARDPDHDQGEPNQRRILEH